MAQTALRLGGYQPENSVHSRALHHVAAAAAERDHGGFLTTVNIDVTAQGHRATDLCTMVEDGRLDGCYVASSYLMSRVPALAVFDLPFVATDRARDYGKLDGAFGVRLAADIASRTPFRVLGYWDNGFRHISNRHRAIVSPDDCRGLTMRTLDNRLHQEVFATLGFTPVFIDLRDLATAVAAGRVDAQENPLTNLINYGLHAHHKHVSLTAHFFGVALFVVRERWIEALSSEQRNGLFAAVKAATQRQRDMAIAEDARCLGVLAESGVTVTGPEAIAWAAFRTAVAPIVEHEVARLAGGA